MRNTVVIRQFYDLRVDKNQFNLVRGSTVQKTGDNRIDAHRFTGARGACYQKVGHFRKVGGNNITADILAQTDAQMLLGIAHTACLHNLTEAHGIVLRVRRFDADGGFAGNRCLDTYTGRSQTQGNIIRKVHHRAYLHTCRRLQLKAGNRRSARDGNNSGAHLEVCQSLLQHRTLIHDVLLIGGRVTGLRRIEKLQRGQLIAARGLRFRLICCCGLLSRRRCSNFIRAVKNRYGRLLRFRLRLRLCLGRHCKRWRLLLAIGIADYGSRTLRLRFGSLRLGIIQKAAVRLVIIVIIDNRSYNDLGFGLLPFGQLHRVTLYFLF